MAISACSVLIDEASIAAKTVAMFNIERGEEASVWQTGLQGAEAVFIEFWTENTPPDETVDANWQQLTYDGTSYQLDVNNTMLTIDTAGHYRMRIPSAAGPVKAGTY